MNVLIRAIKKDPCPCFFFFAPGFECVCVSVFLGASTLTKHWKENEGRQPGE